MEVKLFLVTLPRILPHQEALQHVVFAEKALGGLHAELLSGKMD